MKKILILLFCLPLFMLAQRPSGGSGSSSQYSGFSKKKNSTYFRGNISGKIIDSISGEKLEFANISVINAKWNKIVDGTISNDAGKFSVSGLLSGDYILQIKYLGYKLKEVKFKLTKKNPDLNLKEIGLQIDSKLLGEIKIDEIKPIYESKLDKIIYNVENDNNGGSDDATDILRKAPLLSVDFDGNVELRGSKNIKYLLNGKASSFLTGDLATALQMIPADQIKSVEIITSPGAKYDGEGDAGIINIITKKKIIDGYKATLNGSFGTRSNKNSFNLTLGKGRFSLSARANAWYSWPRDGENTYLRKDWNDTILDLNGIVDTNYLTNNGSSRSQWMGYRAGINMFYDINAFNSISSDIGYRGRNTPSESETQLNYNGVDSSNNYNYNSFVDATQNSNNIEWTTDYTKTFEDNEDKELSISYQIGKRFKENNTNIIDEISGINIPVNLNNINNEDNTEQTVQIDYTHPINEHVIELGGKIISRNQRMDYETNSNNSDYVFLPEIFNYNQNVKALYISTKFQLKDDYSLLAGTRYENTLINGDWDRNTNEKFNNSYQNILPNLTISKKLSTGKSLKISYNNRIRRPNSGYINTNTNLTNNKNITVGNPELTPSLTEQLELGYNSFGKKYQGSYYIYLKNTKDIIESFLRVQNDTSITTYQNIGEANYYGFNYYGSLRLENITLRTGFNLYSYNSEDDRFNNRSALLYDYNFGFTVKFINDWKAESFAFVRSPSQTLQGSSTSFSMMSFGIKKEFKNKRGSLGIRIIEPFAKNGQKIFKTELEGNNFNQISERKVLFTSIGISFKYTFGKLNFKSNKSSGKIKNDDLKQESQSEF